MYKVFEVEGGFQVFWCPSAPTHYNDKVPYSDKVYPQRQGAYRKCKQLNDRIRRKQEDFVVSKEVNH
jgi:hypothetical protein